MADTYQIFGLGTAIGEFSHVLEVSLYVDRAGRDILRFVECDGNRFTREVTIPVSQILNAKMIL